MQPKTKKHITLAVGTAVSLACLVWVFSGIDFKQLWIAVKSISPMWLAVSTALFMFTMYLRAVRSSARSTTSPPAASSRPS